MLYFFNYEAQKIAAVDWRKFKVKSQFSLPLSIEKWRHQKKKKEVY